MRHRLVVVGAGLVAAALLVVVTLSVVSAVQPLRHLALRGGVPPGEGWEQLLRTVLFVGFGLLVGAFLAVMSRVPPLAPGLAAVLLVALLIDPQMRPLDWLEGPLPGSAMMGLVSSGNVVLVAAGALGAAAGVWSRPLVLLVERGIDALRRIPLGELGPGLVGGVVLLAASVGGAVAGSRLLVVSVPPTWASWSAMVAAHLAVGAVAALAVLAAVRFPAAPLVAAVGLAAALLVPGTGNGLWQQWQPTATLATWQPTAVLVGIFAAAAVRGLLRAGVRTGQATTATSDR